VPRAKVKFHATSPRSDLWPDQPEEAMAQLAEQNQAEYIPGSLIFTTSGDKAEALFKTMDPGASDTPSRLHQLGIDLDAVEVCLFVGPENWKRGVVSLDC
jgi:hypothetical protein